MVYKTVKLSDVCVFIPGFAFKSKHFGDFNDKVIKITHIVPPRIDMENLIGVDLENYNKDRIKKYLAKKGDFLLAMTGATIGKIGRIEYGEAYVNQRVLLFKPKSIIYPDYLYYYLRTNSFYSYILNHIDSESAQPNISSSTIGDFEMSIPPYEEQVRIGDLLKAYDEMITNNNRIISLLEKKADLLYNLLIEQHFGKEIPQGWSCGVLGDVASIINSVFSISKNKNKILEHFSIPAFDDGRVPTLDKTNDILSNKTKIDNDCVLISKLNPNFKRVWRPHCLSDLSACSPEFIVFKASNIRLKDFVFSIISSDRFTKYMCSHTTGSTNSRQRTTPDSTLDFEIVIPPIDYLISYCEQATPLYDLITVKLEENLKLKQQVNTMIQTFIKNVSLEEEQ